MSKKYKIYAKDLLQYSIDDLWNNLYGEIILIFDDGVEINTNHREVILSRYFWELHIMFPDLPLYHTHFISNYLTNGALTSKTHGGMLSVISSDILKFVMREYIDPIKMEKMLKREYEIVNEIYNDVIVKLSKYVLSIDIIDFLDVVDHPEIKVVHKKVEDFPTQENVNEAYEVVARVMGTDVSLQDNNLIKAYRANTVNKNQLLQCIGPRGYVTELNSKSFKLPVTGGYVKGLKNIYEMAIESRSGSKALFLADAALKDSEYFARRLQLLTMTVTNIHHTDCGTQKYLLWRLKGELIEDGLVKYGGDLKYMAGKKYLNEKTGNIETLTEDNEDLIGTIVKLRSPLYCSHEDAHGVCSVCFGDMAKNISRFAPIGHVSSVTLTHQTTQSVLSTKHLDFINGSFKIALTYRDKKYFKISVDGNGFILQKGLSRKDLKIIIPQKDLIGLSDIYITDKVDKINPGRISNISTIVFSIETPAGLMLEPVDIYRDNRKGMLSIEFLEYIKEVGYDTDNDGNFIIKLDGWKVQKPMFRLPLMEYNYAEHGSAISRLIERAVNTLGAKKEDITPDSILSKLFDLVNSKLFVNLSFLETIIYAISVRDSEGGDYGLARNVESPSLASGAKIIYNRSMSAEYAYEELPKRLLSPSSFFKNDRPDHPLDVMIRPYEVLTQTKTIM